jgi:gamma-polyglutamate biosynthesis protein CapC
MQLPIFPSQALDSSVITTVWVGLCVIAFLNLRYGMTLAGLVVPGYIVPLIITKPASACVIVIEALVTYALTRLIASKFMRAANASEMFGRDRFFAVLLVSIVVRTAFDGWLLPKLANTLESQGYIFDYQNNLYSFGLVVIALIANQMWNGGLWRGLQSFMLYCGITWLIIALILVPFTNFDLSNLNFLYEDLATDILSSPKGYLILLTTAFLASRMNLYYGWEFSGILVPALLSLQWYTPSKFFISLFEAFVIFALGRAALKLPMFRKMNMEGSRLLLLFFTVGYIYKVLLGHVFGHFFPHLKVSDYYAFGYLISTLIAVKMHQKQLSWQMTRVTLQTSLMGLFLASIMGYAFVTMSNFNLTKDIDNKITHHSQPTASMDLKKFLLDEKKRLYESELALSTANYPSTDLALFEQAIKLLQQANKSNDTSRQQQAYRWLKQAQFQTTELSDWIIITDVDTRRGSGVFGLRKKTGKRLLIEAPYPLDEYATAESCINLAIKDADFFSLGGFRKNQSPENKSDVLSNRSLPFSSFHFSANASGIIQIRAKQKKVADNEASEIWASGQLPEQISLETLAKYVGKIDLHWGIRTNNNQLVKNSKVAVAELLLTRDARLKILAQNTSADKFSVTQQAALIDGDLYLHLMENKKLLALPGSESYVKPSVGDLLFIQEELVKPLYALAQTWQKKEDYPSLAALAISAHSVGYQILIYRQLKTNEQHFLLVEQAPAKRFWGTYVFRTGDALAEIIEVPRLLAEKQTFEYGVHLYERRPSRALLLPGAHYHANNDQSADVLDTNNRYTMFSTVGESLLLAMGRDGLTLQIRGANAVTDASTPDIVIANAYAIPFNNHDGKFTDLMTSLTADNATVGIAGDSWSTRAYQPSYDAQSVRFRTLNGPRFLTIWLTKQLRDNYRSSISVDVEKPKFESIGIKTLTIDLSENLANATLTMPDQHLISAIDDYLLNQDIIKLENTLLDHSYLYERVIEKNTGQAFLLIRQSSGALVGIRKLTSSSTQQLELSLNTKLSAEAIIEFERKPFSWLIGGSP